MQGIWSKLWSKMSLALAAVIACASAAPLPPVAAAHASARPKVINIASARALPAGTAVTIEGVVTVPSGLFKSSIADDGFALQDQSAGIYVSMKTNLGLRVGQRVRVNGTLSESNNLLRVVAESAGVTRARGRAPIIRPRRVRTGEVGEATEGRLVQVTGAITKPVASDPPYGFRLYVDDRSGEIQVYVSASARIDLSRLQPGQRITVTGIGGQYQDHYELEPRFQADIESE